MTYKPNKLKNLSRLLPLLLLSVLFYGVMGFLTLKASDIHYARLPQVTTGQLGNEEFTFFLPDYPDTERTRSILAIPKELYESGQVFKIEIKTKDDFTYYYARQVWAELEMDKQNEHYYAIKRGIMRSDHIILDGYEELYDGMEVFPMNLHKKESK